MKLTDESVAKALDQIVDVPKGWWAENRLKPRAGAKYWLKGKALCSTLPAYTTSLDVIVAEIEARELDWLVQTDVSGKGYGYFAEVSSEQATASAKTAPLALCAALLAHLREHSHAR